MTCTIYKNIFDFKNPHKIKVMTCLERIRDGKSKELIEKIRTEQNKDLQDAHKKNLPSVVFTGFFPERLDQKIQNPTNLCILDFDDVDDAENKKLELSNNPYVLATWVSPRANGVKALVKISDSKLHKEHFLALEKEFIGVDKSGKNISRVCYESYDPNIYINENSKVFTKIFKEEIHTEIKQHFESDSDSYANIKRWLEKNKESFVSGNRNFYIFKLASACCRFGIDQYSALNFILQDYATSDFSQSEIKLALKSAYKSNVMGSATFDKNELVTSTTNKIVEIKELELEYEEFSHIIFGEAVKSSAMDIYNKGYQKLNGINTPIFDRFFKSKRQEVTLWTGYGNMGKSTKLKWFLLNRAVLYGEKYALFDPEASPAEESYMEFVEMLAGCDCTPNNPNRPNVELYTKYYDFVSKHFFYVYPEKVKPTLVALKEAFLELIIKYKVDGAVIDPFNQMYHDRGKMSREDHYLEEVLADVNKFAIENDIFFHIVAHPTGNPERDGIDFKAPDMYKVSGGAMWSNKMHNIIIYHRPKSRSEPDNPLYDLIIDKIKKKKITGKTGSFSSQYILSERRFKMPFWDDLLKREDSDRMYDPLANNMKKSAIFEESIVIVEEVKKPLPKINPSDAFESDDDWENSFEF